MLDVNRLLLVTGQCYSTCSGQNPSVSVKSCSFSDPNSNKWLVKVIWHKAASPPQTSGKIVFAIVNLPSHKGMLVPPGKYYWICASFGPTRVHRLTANRVVQPFCTAHGRGLSDTVLSPNNCPFAWGIWAPSNICFLGPTQVHNPNGILISSTVFEQMSTVSLYFTMGSSPSKLPLPMGDVDPHLIHGSLGPPKFWIQTASRSRPSLQGPLLWLLGL